MSLEFPESTLMHIGVCLTSHKLSDWFCKENCKSANIYQMYTNSEFKVRQ